MGKYIFTSANLNYPPTTYDSVRSIADLFYDRNPSHYTPYAYDCWIALPVVTALVRHLYQRRSAAREGRRRPLA